MGGHVVIARLVHTGRFGEFAVIVAFEDTFDRRIPHPDWIGIRPSSIRSLPLSFPTTPVTSEIENRSAGMAIAKVFFLLSA